MPSMSAFLVCRRTFEIDAALRTKYSLVAVAVSMCRNQQAGWRFKSKLVHELVF